MDKIEAKSGSTGKSACATQTKLRAEAPQSRVPVPHKQNPEMKPQFFSQRVGSLGFFGVLQWGQDFGLLGAAVLPVDVGALHAVGGFPDGAVLVADSESGDDPAEDRPGIFHLQLRIVGGGFAGGLELVRGGPGLDGTHVILRAGEDAGAEVDAPDRFGRGVDDGEAGAVRIAPEVAGAERDRAGGTWPQDGEHSHHAAFHVIGDVAVEHPGAGIVGDHVGGGGLSG